jgi:hypothetical protein
MPPPLSTNIEGSAVPSNSTSLALAKPAPDSNALSPPSGFGDAGSIPEMVGIYVNCSALVATAPDAGMRTVTGTGPEVSWEGVVALTVCPSGDTDTPVVATPPTSTVAPWTSLPWRLITVPPVAGPLVWSIELTTGGFHANVAALGAEAPAPLVTTARSGGPGMCGGDVTWSMVSGLVASGAHAWPDPQGIGESDPKATDVAPVNPVPVIVMSVPPALGPDGGCTPDIDGGQATFTTVASNFTTYADPAASTATPDAPPPPASIVDNAYWPLPSYFVKNAPRV